MLRKLTFIAALGASILGLAAPAGAETTRKDPMHPAGGWSFEGLLGGYDQAQLQRGFKVYREVCSSCHSMNMVAFRNLGDPGGPFYDPKYPVSIDNPYVKALAKDYPPVPDIDTTTGDPTKRPATPADHLPAPFANEIAARGSNGGALPPDMSLLARGREGGAAYIYSIVSIAPGAPAGEYAPTPAGLTVPAGKHYNPYMPGDLSSYWKGDPDKVPIGGFIAMPPPLSPNKVAFDDKTPSTVANEARDVAAFLAWASDPHMEQRKQTGLAVMIFLLVFTGLLYASYRALWRNVDH